MVTPISHPPRDTDDPQRNTPVGEDGTPARDLVGTEIGQYRVVRRIGKGGMGTVYEAVHTQIGQRAAVKVLNPNLAGRESYARRFIDEARIVGKVGHPGLIKVFDFGKTADRDLYILMEFLEGEELWDRIKPLHERGETLPLRDSLRIARQVASALAAVHAQNIIHRDLKPENVFLVHDPDSPSGERAKILDFGIAEVTPEADCRSIFPLDREVLATQGLTDRKATDGDPKARSWTGTGLLDERPRLEIDRLPILALRHRREDLKELDVLARREGHALRGEQVLVAGLAGARAQLDGLLGAAQALHQRVLGVRLQRAAVAEVDHHELVAAKEEARRADILLVDLGHVAEPLVGRAVADGLGPDRVARDEVGLPHRSEPEQGIKVAGHRRSLSAGEVGLGLLHGSLLGVPFGARAWSREAGEQGQRGADRATHTGSLPLLGRAYFAGFVSVACRSGCSDPSADSVDCRECNSVAGWPSSPV